MRILIIVDCYLPSHKSGAKQIHDLAMEFQRRGNEVTVLAPSETISQKLDVCIEDGLCVARVKTRRMKDTTKVLRAWREATLSPLLWSRAKHFFMANPNDLIVFYSPTIFLGPLVGKLKSLWGCPAYLILRDIFPEWAVDAGILRRGFVYRFFRKVETWQYEAADLIAVQSPGDLEYFARVFPRKRFRLEVLYNWTTLREADLPQTNLRTQLGLQNKVVFFYGGNIGVAQDMDNILRLAARLSMRNNIHFLLVGEGSEVVRLKQSIAAQGLCNIQILPSVSQREYLSIVSEFDVGLVSLHPRFKTHNIPGKILGYLYWGKPVLASINAGNDLCSLLEKNQAGFCFVNGDDENLAIAAQMLANDIGLRSKIGRSGRQLLEQTFSVEAAANKIRAHLQDAGFDFPRSDSLASVRASRQDYQPELIRQP